MPLIISCSFIEFCLFNTTDQDNLLDSFNKYVSLDEKELLEKALKGDDPDVFSSDEMLDMLDVFKCRTLMTAENAKTLVVEIARQELIQKPYIMAACWSNSFESLKKKDDFLSLENLKVLYSKTKATPRKVIQLFNCTPIDDAERESFAFLKRYVRGLDCLMLNKCLRFTTGSESITVQSIEVTFNKNFTAFSRRPIAHTCGPLLELPAVYTNFCELREDFANISHNTWEMNII